VLKWARETSGATVEETAKRLRVAASTSAGWEAVESLLTLGQMCALSAYFKRPLAALLLPEINAMASKILGENPSEERQN